MLTTSAELDRETLELTIGSLREFARVSEMSLIADALYDRDSG